jgi:hypothetical protein
MAFFCNGKAVLIPENPSLKQPLKSLGPEPDTLTVLREQAKTAHLRGLVSYSIEEFRCRETPSKC